MHFPEDIPADPRSSGELAEDWIDQELVELYFAWGLGEIDVNRTFNRTELLAYIRTSFAAGLAIGSNNHIEVTEWLEAYSSAKLRLSNPNSTSSEE
jgi:hypothetical protein